MAEVIPQITIDGSKVKETWVQKEVVTNDVYNAINKAVINLKDNNNLLDSNAMLFREEYNSSSKNLNNAIHQGIYSFTNSAVNAPSGVNGGNLLVTNTSKTNQGSSIITQIAFCHNGAIYIRTKNTTENFTNWILVSGNTGGIKSIQGSNDTLTITKGDNSTQDININNVKISEKATQDSQGQTINTTYVKGVSASNATLTITKGNGTTSTATINNVANATKATQDGDGNTINTTYLKLSGGTMKGNIYFTGVTSGIQRIIKNTEFDSGITFTPDFMGFWDWRDNTRVLTYNYNKKELTAGVAINGVTPSTSDNSTKIATTAFVHNLLGRAVGKTQPTLTALIDWEDMKSANGGVDVRNIRNTTYGVIAYGGDVKNASLGEGGNIFLKQNFNTFDAILINYTNDDGSFNEFSLFPMWEFYLKYNTKGVFNILQTADVYWRIRGSQSTTNPSTLTKLNIYRQNSGIIEIYGVTY